RRFDLRAGQQGGGVSHPGERGRQRLGAAAGWSIGPEDYVVQRRTALHIRMVAGRQEPSHIAGPYRLGRGPDPRYVTIARLYTLAPPPFDSSFRFLLNLF